MTKYIHNTTYLIFKKNLKNLKTHIWFKIKTTKNEENEISKIKTLELFLKKKPSRVQLKKKLEISNLHTYKEKCKGEVMV
jgi:hypothetical protein